MIKAIFAVAVSAALCSSARAETVDELYAKARSEGSVVFYGSGPTVLWEKHVNLFKQRYPGIDVKLEGGFSNVLDKKVDEQIRANKLEVDVIVLQLVQDFERWKKEGLLLPFKPEGFDKIDANWKDADGMYVGVSVFAHPYAYNSNLVKPERHPEIGARFLEATVSGQGRFSLSAG